MNVAFADDLDECNRLLVLYMTGIVIQFVLGCRFSVFGFRFSSVTVPYHRMVSALVRVPGGRSIPFEKLFVVNKKISFHLNIIFLYCYVFAHFQFFVFNGSCK